MHTITILKKVVLWLELFSPLVTCVTKITGEWENNLHETYREGLADTLCVWSLFCLLLQWRVCVCGQARSWIQSGVRKSWLHEFCIGGNGKL